MEHVKMKIEGMNCGHCVRAVNQALEGVPGVQVERVEIGSATVAYDPGAARVEQITEAVQAAGYDVQDSGEAP